MACLLAVLSRGFPKSFPDSSGVHYSHHFKNVPLLRVKLVLSGVQVCFQPGLNFHVRKTIDMCCENIYVPEEYMMKIRLSKAAVTNIEELLSRPYTVESIQKQHVYKRKPKGIISIEGQTTGISEGIAEVRQMKRTGPAAS